MKRGRQLSSWILAPPGKQEPARHCAEGEKVLVIKEIAKVKTNKSIAERINRCVMTEIGESVRIFGKILQRENLGLIAVI